MFSILINYSDFFDFEILTTIDEFFLNYSISKQPFEFILEKLIASSILVLFLPLCKLQSHKILDLLVKSNKSPRFVICLDKIHSPKLEEYCIKHSFYYFHTEVFKSKFIKLISSIKGSISSNYLYHKDLFLNVNSRKCIRDNKSIILTNQEFYLLKYLLENNERPISKAELLEAVWGFKSTVPTRSVDVYISRLRSKIDQKFDNKYIKTIHCYGYVLS